VFGRRAGRTAARLLKPTGAGTGFSDAARPALALISAGSPASRGINTAAMLARLQATMSDDVGPFRTAAGLQRALTSIGQLQTELGETPPGAPAAFDLARLDWFDLRNMLLVARVVTEAARLREESRGAHQREDFPGLVDDWQCNQTIALAADGAPRIGPGPRLSSQETAA
jgi:succinate dehydrogenase / fumarate reductase, flavoprotein subunit